MQTPEGAPDWAAEIVASGCPEMFSNIGLDASRHAIVARMVEDMPATLEIRSRRHPLSADVGIQVRLDAKVHDLRAITAQAKDLVWLDQHDDRMRAAGLDPIDAPLWTMCSDAITARLFDMHAGDARGLLESGAILDRAMDSVYLRVIGLGGGVHLHAGRGAHFDIDSRRVSLPESAIANLPGMPADQLVSHALVDGTGAIVTNVEWHGDVIRAHIAIPAAPAAPAPTGVDTSLVARSPWRRQSVPLVPEKDL